VGVRCWVPAPLLMSSKTAGRWDGTGGISLLAQDGYFSL
jgi:hypothetical protein